MVGCASCLSATDRCDVQRLPMARPSSPKKSSADAAYKEVGQAIESLRQKLEQLRREGAARAVPAWSLAVLVGGG